MKVEDNTFENLENCLQGKKLFLFGASGSAKGFIMRQGKRFQIDGIFDNNPEKWNTKWEGYFVFSTQEIEKLNKDTCVILITSSYELEIERQLQELGVKYIFSSHLCENRWTNWHEPIQEKDKKYVEKVRELLADEHSKERLDKIVEYRENRLQYWEDMFDGKQYFQDIYSFSDTEVFVDGGAYTGDTIAEFLKHTQNKFKRIYAFEPDETNYQTLQKAYEDDERIISIPCGLWSSDTTLHFDKRGNSQSTVCEQSDSSITVKSIDEWIKEDVTFIKMDIEGSEMEALKGAEKTIRRCHPKLAICLYHKNEDLWEIPLYIHEIVPEYKLYIRHHSMDCNETVLYAVDEERE